MKFLMNSVVGLALALIVSCLGEVALSKNHKKQNPLVLAAGALPRALLAPTIIFSCKAFSDAFFDEFMFNTPDQNVGQANTRANIYGWSWGLLQSATFYAPFFVSYFRGRRPSAHDAPKKGTDSFRKVLPLGRETETKGDASTLDQSSGQTTHALDLQGIRSRLDQGERGDAVAMIDSAKELVEGGMVVRVADNGKIVQKLSSVDQIELFKAEEMNR